MCHDAEVRAHFSQICFVGVGQVSNGGAKIRDLQTSLHLQISGKPLDTTATDDQAILNMLCDAAAGKRILLLIDDAWDLNHVRALACLDMTTRSAMVVTTRIRGLLPAGAKSF